MSRSSGFTGKKHTFETTAKMSAAHKGVPKSAEHKAKIAAAQHGGRSHLWKGDDIGYDAAHLRHRKVLPRVCAHADETCKGPLHIAFRHGTPAEYVKIDPRSGRPYSLRVEDYTRLCASHHSRYDWRIAS